jgi:hypothetical protein
LTTVPLPPPASLGFCRLPRYFPENRGIPGLHRPTLVVYLLLLMPGCAAGTQASAQQQAKVPVLPGAQLALAEIARVKPPVGEGFNYRLQATGLPSGKTYELEVRRVGGEVDQMPIGALHVDVAGRLVAEKGVSLEQVVFGTGPIYKGEPLEPALVAEDGSGQIVARIVPAPIEASGAGGCRLSVELMDPTGNVFRIRGEGFEPGKEVRTPPPRPRSCPTARRGWRPSARRSRTSSSRWRSWGDICSNRKPSETAAFRVSHGKQCATRPIGLKPARGMAFRPIQICC